MRIYASGSEAPRRFSDVLSERRRLDSAAIARERALDNVAELESLAAQTGDAAESKRLLCEAEALRCLIDDNRR